MTARRLLAVVHTMLLDAHGPDEAAAMLAAPDPAEARAERAQQLRSMGVEVGQ